MDKRVFIAAGISVLVLVAWSYMFPPPERPPRPVGPDPAAVGQVESRPQASPQIDEAPPRAEFEPVEAAELVQAEQIREIKIDNGVFQLTLTNRGGVATSWKPPRKFLASANTKACRPTG